MLYKNFDRRRKLLFDIGLCFQGGGASYPAVLDDGNTVGWYDYEKGLITTPMGLVTTWQDQSGNDNHLGQANPSAKPTLTEDGVLFSGVDFCYMSTDAFTLVQPEFIYILFKQVSWTVNDYVFDGVNSASGMLTQRGTSPTVRAYAGTFSSDNSNMVIGAYSVVRILFNGADSKLIVDETTPITGNFGSSGMGGFTLGSRSGGSTSGNIEVQEVIIRKVSDSALDESAIYEYLKKKIN